MLKSASDSQVTAMNYSAQVIIGPELFSKVTSEEWNRVASSGMTNTPFQQHDYQAAWWRHLGEGELFAILIHDEPGQLVGIAPLNIRGERVVFNGSKEESDYLDLIAPVEQAAEVWAAVIDCLCSEPCPAWSELDFYNIPAASPSRTILPRLASSRGFVLTEEKAEVCPVIRLESDFESYLAGIDKKQRHEIRRKLRRANGAEAELVVVDKNDDLDQQVDLFLDLLAKSTPEKETWLNDGRRALFYDVARSALDQDNLLLMFMKVEGEAVSALFNFCYDGRVWVYNSGIDISRHSRLSLGVVLTAAAIEYAIEKGYQAFDFLRGDEEYKYRFGAQDTEIFRIKIVKEG